MNKDELRTYIRLKHFPTEGSIEYITALPKKVAYQLYKQMFADGEVGNLVTIRLMHILQDPQWKVQVEAALEELLVEHYTTI